MNEIKIEVTAEDIAAGAVGVFFAGTDKPRWLDLRHDDAAAFIRSFDAGEPVTPCTITLTPRTP